MSDPNVGVYQVRDVRGFMNARSEGYRIGKSWTLSPPFRNDWIHCDTR